MFQQLVSHNPDIEKLLKVGFSIAFDTNHLVIRDVPYLDKNKGLQFGTFVSKLDCVNRYEVRPADHTIYFSGESPCSLNGEPIKNIGDSPVSLKLSDACQDFAIQRRFSCKPSGAGKYEDIFHKVETYLAIVSGPAMELYGDKANPYTFNHKTVVDEEPVFKYRDTLTSRAEISEINERVKDDVIAIIGLGGTGSYLLDIMVKTPVKEVRAFDHDFFHVHNAFRSPGRLEEEELGMRKSDVYLARYDEFRTGLNFHSQNINSCSDDLLSGVSFAFVCVDKGESRKEVFDVLIRLGIPFIDVGMGLSKDNEKGISGMVRATYFSKESSQKVRDNRVAMEHDDPNDIYRTNIQISELNALNACLAVIQYKRIRGFYVHDGKEYNFLFDVSDMKVVSDALDED